LIIVTGGAGFIGSNITAGLEARGYGDIAIIDSLGSGDKWKNIAKRELAAVARPCDAFDFLRRREREISCVIHMGAVSDTTETDADLIAETNFTFSWNLWEYCRDYGKSFIYASSAATYGAGEHGFDDRDDLPYLNSLRPLNLYGWSKALFDRKVAREAAEKRPLPPQYAGLKFFNVYGPNEYHKGPQKSVAAHIFPVIRSGRPASLFKSGDPAYRDGWQLRDFVWVGDCVDAVLWLIENPGVSGIFNVGSGEARSFYDLARIMFEALDMEPKIEYRDMPEELSGRYQYYTKAETQKLASRGYPAKATPIEEGVAKYVRSFLTREDMYV
jgi:ADP-L-glycero-D-manno-heptose 6-epimerase